MIGGGEGVEGVIDLCRIGGGIGEEGGKKQNRQQRMNDAEAERTKKIGIDAAPVDFSKLRGGTFRVSPFSLLPTSQQTPGDQGRIPQENLCSSAGAVAVTLGRETLAGLRLEASSLEA